MYLHNPWQETNNDIIQSSHLLQRCRLANDAINWLPRHVQSPRLFQKLLLSGSSSDYPNFYKESPELCSLAVTAVYKQVDSSLGYQGSIFDRSELWRHCFVIVRIVSTLWVETKSCSNTESHSGILLLLSARFHGSLLEQELDTRFSICRILNHLWKIVNCVESWGLWPAKLPTGDLDNLYTLWQ